MKCDKCKYSGPKRLNGHLLDNNICNKFNRMSKQCLFPDPENCNEFMCPNCSMNLDHISFFKFKCPECGKRWAITEITNTNRGYYADRKSSNIGKM